MKISARTLIGHIIVQVACLSVILLLIQTSKLKAQQLSKKKVYKLKIIDKNESALKGYLISVRDSTLHLNERLDGSGAFEVKTDQIKLIKVRRKGSIGKGIAIGAATGGVLGYIIGYASYQEPDCTGTFFCFDYGPESDGAAGMTLGILIGGTIGGIVGGSSKKFEINGDQNSFELIKPELSKYQLLYDPLVDVK
jgi:hypothetical protein